MKIVTLFIMISLITVSAFAVYLCGVYPTFTQATILAVEQWSSPQKICDGYYPSIAQLDGAIWVAYTNADGGANEVRVRSSNDGGLTWSEPKVVFEADTQWVAWCAQGTTLLSSDGVLYLAWHANRNPAGGTAEIWFTKSVDGGTTWSAAAKPYEGNAPWNGYGFPRLVEMQNKIWLFFTHTESSRYMTTSDGGNTWSEIFELTPYYSQKQSPIADYVSDEIWLVYTKWDAGPPADGMTPGQEIRLIKSSDGIAWSAYEEISEPAAPYGAQSAALTKYYKDRVFIFFSSWADGKWGVYLTASSDGTAWSAPEIIVDNIYTNHLAAGSIAIVEDKLWLVYTSPDGEVWYTMYPSACTASIDVDPDMLNLRSQGNWITAYIQLPEGSDAMNIDANSILLNNTISAISDPQYDFVTDPNEYLFDHNGDGILERMVKFDRTAVQLFIYDQGFRNCDIALTITGKLFDDTTFEGTDIITVVTNAPFKH